MTTEQYLLEQYGPLLTVEQLATILHRRPGGLRMSLTSNNEFAHLARRFRRQIGRRVYYETALVSELLAPETPSSERVPR